MTGPQQFCTFFLDGLFFGVEVHKVQEVLRCQDMTRVPLASAEIGGLLNLRGQIVTAVDLRSRLGLPERASGVQPMNVVVRTSDGVISMLVDEIGDVVEVEESSFELPPETVTSTARQMIRGVHKLKEKLLLVLDMEKAVEITGAAKPARVSG
jgi:purine-binding chemotaxis protein CheW